MLRSTDQGDLRAETLRIFGTFEQPILKLHVAIEGSVRQSFSDIDFSRRLNSGREVRFDEVDESAKQRAEVAPSNTYSDSRSSQITFHLTKLKRMSARYERLFFLALLVTILISGCTATLVVVFVKQAATDLDNSVRHVSDIGLRRMQTALLALSSRELLMAALHHDIFWNETAARGLLDSASAELLAMRSSLESSADSYTGRYRDYVLQGRAPFWQWENHGFRLEHLPLVDLMTRLAQSAAQLQATPLEAITPSNPDFLTLFRNSAGETLSVFNFTVELYMDGTEDTRSSNEALLQLLVYLSMIGLCILTLGAMLPLILVSSLRRKEMWTSLLTCSSTDLAALRVKTCERLQETHGQEEVRPAGRARGGSAKYTLSRSAKVILVCLIFYLCCVCVVLYLIYDIGSNKPSKLLLEKPHYMNWSGERRALIVLSAFWLREIWLESSPYAIDRLLAMNQIHPSPVEAWNDIVSVFLSAHTSLTYGDATRHLTAFLPSSVRKERLLGTCDTCATPAQRGLTPLIYEIAHTQRGVVECLQAQGTYLKCGGGSAESLLTPAAELVGAALIQLDEDSSEELHNYQFIAELLTAGFAVFSVVLLTLVFVPLVRKVTVT